LFQFPVPVKYSL